MGTIEKWKSAPKQDRQRKEKVFLKHRWFFVSIFPFVLQSRGRDDPHSFSFGWFDQWEDEKRGNKRTNCVPLGSSLLLPSLFRWREAGARIERGPATEGHRGRFKRGTAKPVLLFHAGGGGIVLQEIEEEGGERGSEGAMECAGVREDGGEWDRKDERSTEAIENEWSALSQCDDSLVKSRKSCIVPVDMEANKTRRT